MDEWYIKAVDHKIKSWGDWFDDGDTKKRINSTAHYFQWQVFHIHNFASYNASIYCGYKQELFTKCPNCKLEIPDFIKMQLSLLSDYPTWEQTNA